MAQVKIGWKMFINELRVYRDWSERLFGEYIQNSTDAGASRIDFNFGAVNENIQSIVISDNGSGMDRETLENVYMVLGETTKTGNTVGGFGKARILTTFAHRKYTIRTNKLYVEGSGADYEISETETHHRGVEVDVEVDTKGIDMKAKLEGYLSRCHLDGVSVYINGERWTKWTYKNKLERELSFGKVYANKSKQAGIYVRVNGVHMFEVYTSAPFLVMVEIDSEKSREVLQASRDGLLRQYHAELESFVNELNINKSSALRKKRSKSIRYEGTGTFTSRRSKQKDADKEVEEFVATLAANNLRVDDNVLTAMANTSSENRREVIGKILEANGIAPVAVQGRLHSGGYENEEETVSLDYEMFNVMVEDSTSNEKVRKVIETYYPQNWDLLGLKGSRNDKRYGEARSFRAGVEKYKTLVMWQAACEFVLRLLQDELQYGGDEINWGVGWIFSDDGEAAHKYDGVHWLLFNPTKANGNMRVSLSDRKSLGDFVANACHEVAHIVYGDHDERWGNLCDDLHKQAFNYKTEILQHMKNCKDAAMERLEKAEQYAKGRLFSAA